MYRRVEPHQSAETGKLTGILRSSWTTVAVANADWPRRSEVGAASSSESTCGRSSTWNQDRSGADQFRSPAPPSISSPEYAAGLNEVETMGSAASSPRTPAQTATAQFWNANTVNQYNQVFREVATNHGLDLVDTVRLFAMGDMVGADAGIACMDSKYHYLYWRPVTAIRGADLDSNPATAPNATWTPLLTTPNHPEYPSAHGCVSSAVMNVLASVLKSQTINIDVPGATGGGTTLTTTTHFTTVQDLLQNVADARVWAGLHYRFSTTAGVNLGAQVSKYDLQHNFQPATK